MADSDSTPPDSSKPSTKTSTVPLKKETVRITLRARPEETGPVAPKGSTAPVATKGGAVPAPTPAPPIPTAIGAPAPPPAPSAPRPPAAPPAPRLGAPAPPGAKTIPLAKAPPPSAPPIIAGGVPIGAKTIPLAKAPKPGGPPAGRQTTPLSPPGGAKPLPQATVKLQKTQPMVRTPAVGGVPAAPDIKSTAADTEDEWDEEYEESGLMAFSVVVLLLSLAVLGITLFTWSLTQS